MWVPQEWKIQVGLKALGLPPEVVAVNSNIQASNELLPALLGAIRRFREQDQPGASPPRRLPQDPKATLASHLIVHKSRIWFT